MPHVAHKDDTESIETARYLISLRANAKTCLQDHNSHWFSNVGIVASTELHLEAGFTGAVI